MGDRVSSSRGVSPSALSADHSMMFAIRLVIGGAAILLAALLFFPVVGLGQEDTLILLGSNDTVTQITAVSAYNRNAFVGDWQYGMKVFDYSDPSNPYLVAHHSEYAFDLEIRNSLAYCGGLSMYIKDASAPLDSQLVGYCCYIGNPNFRIHIFDTLALVLHSSPLEEVYLEIIDVSDRTSPELLSRSSAPPSGTIHWGDAYKKGDLVFWADDAYLWDEGIHRGRIIVLDITDPATPVPIVVDTCLQCSPRAIYIKDDYAYLAEDHGGRGVVVLDVSDPYDIDSVGFFEIPEGSARNVYVKGSYAYVCADVTPTLEYNRVYVLDISDPTNPSPVTYHDTPGSPRDVFVDDPYVLVADYTSLLIFEASFLEIPGDVNEDGIVNIGDVVLLVNFLYRGGSPPDSMDNGDVNGDCIVDVGDVVYLVNYLYRNGPAPLPGCG
jgi:hypothetical protein